VTSGGRWSPPRSPRPTFEFIGGKGGVGKTTCAAAIATRRAAAGERVLVISTDPAPSLGDALKVRLATSARRVPPAGGSLFAAEIDGRRVLQRWLAGRRPLLERIAVGGTWLDPEDVARLLRLSLPGIDELAALLEIATLAQSSRFDRVVVDTAPTGHTLRMLAMPQTLFALASVFDTMREKQRVVQEALRGGWESGPEDRLITELAATASDLHALLRDPDRSHTAWVTLPEPMALAESTDALEALRSSGIPVPLIIVNRVTPMPPRPCGHCDARRVFEREALRLLPGAEHVAVVEARDVEPRGSRALRSLGAEIERPATIDGGRRQRSWSAALETAGSPVRLPAGPRLVLFGGKGGVGKTTCAAAVAVAHAAESRDQRVLLISTDPAHSLGDVLGEVLSDEARPVRGGPANLFVRELDAGAVLARLRERYFAAVDGIFDRMRGGSAFDAAHDRSVMRALIDLAPPGLDELAAILEITRSFADGPASWDLVVMDTAPTGHALRLLEMPELVHDWTKALMAILLKYREVLGVGELGALLLDLSKNLRRLRELLTDPASTVFIAVCRPASLPRLETVRLLRQLSRLRIAVAALVINTVGRGDCRRCVKAAAAQAREIRALQRETRPPLTIVAPAQIPAPAGPASLRRWRAAWRQAATGGRKSA